MGLNINKNFIFYFLTKIKDLLNSYSFLKSILELNLDKDYSLFSLFGQNDNSD